jgi:hypothetical protein
MDYAVKTNPVTTLTNTFTGRQWQDLGRSGWADASKTINPSESVFSTDGTCLAMVRASTARPAWIFEASDEHEPRPFRSSSSPEWFGSLRAVSNGAKLLAREFGNYSMVIVEARSGRPLVLSKLNSQPMADDLPLSASPISEERRSTSPIQMAPT